MNLEEVKSDIIEILKKAQIETLIKEFGSKKDAKKAEKVWRNFMKTATLAVREYNGRNQSK